MPDNPAKKYPLPRFHFLVQWGGTRVAFTEVSGLTVETEVIEYRSGNSPQYNKTKQPGLTVYSNIVLKRGVFVGDFDMFTLWKQTVFFQESAGKFRQDIAIQLLDEEHQPVITWNVKNAWPCKVAYGDLKADASEILIETMELVHEGLSIAEAS